MPNAKCSYTLREEEELTEKIREYPVIYDKSAKGHKDNVVVENAWKDVASKLDFLENGADEAKKIFENFKKRFQKKKQKLKTVSRSGTNTLPVKKAREEYDKYKFFHWFNEFTRKRKSTTNSKSKKRKVRGKNADIKELLKGINTSESEDANYDDFDSDEEMDLARISPAAIRQTLPSNNNQADTFRSSGSEKDEDSKDDEEMDDPEVRETEKERELREKKQKQQKERGCIRSVVR